MNTLSWGNPYTHEEHERTSYNTAKSEGPQYAYPFSNRCFWCGQARKTLYQYDRTHGMFCNKECWRAYHR